jgi:hypothetical protein
MKPITLEWIDKAEGDWTSAQREYRACQRPHYDAACFHAQQCAETYLKARLEEAGIAFRLALTVEATWAEPQPHLTALNIYAVAFRYPGSSATKSNAANALKAGRGVAPHYASVVWPACLITGCQ